MKKRVNGYVSRGQTHKNKIGHWHAWWKNSFLINRIKFGCWITRKKIVQYCTVAREYAKCQRDVFDFHLLIWNIQTLIIFVVYESVAVENYVGEKSNA